MNSPVRSVVSLSLLLSLIAPHAFAGSAEQDWLDGARKFDGFVGGGPVVGVKANAFGGPRYSYRPEAPATVRLERKAGQDSAEVPLEVRVDRVWTQLDMVMETYEDLDCVEVKGEGRGDWHGYYQARKGEKANALMAAVKGVGPATAQCIVDTGVLSPKPRSWNQFKDAMRQADQACGKGIYGRVVDKFGETNAQALGYYSDQDCRKVQRTELVPELVEHSEFDHAAQTTVAVRFEGGALLPSESDSFMVGYDGVNTDLQANSRYNRYQISRDGDGYVAVGQRQAVTPNNSLLVEILPNGSMRVTDTDFAPRLDNAQAQTVANIKVQVKGGWLRLGIAKTVAETKVPLSGGMRSMPVESLISAVVEKGKEYRISYTLTRMNSLLNNGSESGSKETAWLTR